MGYGLVFFSKRAEKDAKKLEQAGLDKKAKELRKIIREKPPPYEKLTGDLKGLLSRRINITHRMVYEVLEEEKVVKVVSMWTHYE